METRRSSRLPSRHTRRRTPGASVVLVGLAVASLVLGGCGGDTAVSAAEAKVASAQQTLDDANGAAEAASRQFCTASADYVTALDRYGDILNQTAPTVGDVRTAGRDLKDPAENA